MFQPGSKPIAFSSKFLAEHKRELEESILQDDDEMFDEVVPNLNVDPKKTIAKDLPKLEIDIPEKPAPVKRKPYKPKNKPSGPVIYDIEYKFDFEPTRLEPPEIEMPTDYTREYISEQLIDLTYQFCRLSTPKIM